MSSRTKDSKTTAWKGNVCKGMFQKSKTPHLQHFLAFGLHYY